MPSKTPIKPVSEIALQAEQRLHKVLVRIGSDDVHYLRCFRTSNGRQLALNRVNAGIDVWTEPVWEHATPFQAMRKKRYADDANAFFFVDPPYTAGGKKAGARLYTHNEIDHEGLFALMASVRGSVMLTYDDAPEVRSMAERHGFRIEPVPMKNTHHEVIRELLILKP